MNAGWEALLRSYRAPDVFNPWGESDRKMDTYNNSHELRYRRLMAHFDCKPRYLLIGEAPGYQGCRWTGVPFTSERLMIENAIPRIRGAEFSPLSWPITQRTTSWAEPSATIVWKTLRVLGIHEQTVCWNAFPWHPHKPGNPYSNRTPTRAEVFGNPEPVGEPAQILLRQVIDSFSSVVIVAVGAVATKACDYITDRTVHRVRHPANGGATKFREQLGAIVG